MGYNVDGLLCVLFALATSLTSATLTIVPNNQVVAAGSSVTLQCTTNFPGGVIRWSVYRLDNTTPCVVFSSRTYVGACGDGSRHKVSSATTGQFDLVISPTVASDAGTYYCEDVLDAASPTAFAVLGIMLSPMDIFSNVTSSCVSSQQAVVLTCKTAYNGSSLVPLLMTWTSPTTEFVFSPVTNSTDAVFQSTATITVNETDIPSSTCSVTFGPPTSSILPTNPPTAATYDRTAPKYTKSSPTSQSTIKCRSTSATSNAATGPTITTHHPPESYQWNHVYIIYIIIPAIVVIIVCGGVALALRRH